MKAKTIVQKPKNAPAKSKKTTVKVGQFPRESGGVKSKRVLEIIKLLHRYYPDVRCALNFETPFQLLIATILSAQCTDERVNQVTKILFARFPDAEKMAKADLHELEHIVRPTGFFNNKAKNILACSQKLVTQYQGQVPQNLESLVELDGVGRKTANVVLGTAYGIASGVVVDTHVTRLSNRLGLVVGDNAVILERELNDLVPREEWVAFSHLLITHGRRVCRARKPDCANCFLLDLCPRVGLTL